MPYQRVDLAALGLTADQAGESVWWVGADGSRGAGPVAIGYLLRAAGRWWRIPGALVRHPPGRWLAWPIYHWVSRNRHHLPGGTPPCPRNIDQP